MSRLGDKILALSPLAYWPCDDGSGTGVADASGNGRNLAGFSGNTWGTAALMLGSSPGSVNGNASAASAASAAWSNLTSAFTVSFVLDWPTSALLGDHDGLYKGWGSNGYGLRRTETFVSSRQLEMQTSAASVSDEHVFEGTLNSSPQVRLLTGTYAAGTSRLYVDGALVSTKALAAPGSLEAPLYLTSRRSISDVALWDRALTDAEVAGLYSAAIAEPVPARYLGLEVLPGSASLANVAIVTRDGLDDVRASDNESVAMYGHRSTTVDVALSSDDDAEALAEFHANRRSRPAPVLARVDAQVAGAGADALDALAALDLGSAVTLHRTTADNRSLDFFAVVEGLSWDLAPGRQTLALSTAPSDTYGLYGSASWFILGESLLGGTAVLAPY